MIRHGHARRWLLLLFGAIACVVLGAGTVLVTGVGLAHDGGTEVRITAMRHDDGRIEFALQERAGEEWSDRLLPRARFFPASGREGRWLVSTPFTVGVTEAPPAVTRVVDGDTIEVRMPDGELERVRLLLVDTPEVFGGVECYGREASEFVRGLLPAGAVIRLERDVTNRDSFGRLLRYLYLPDGAMLNERLVEGGYAEYNPYDGVNVLYADRIEAAQGRAQAAGAGLWRACPPGPTATSAATPTTTATQSATPSATGTPAAGCDPNYVNLCIPTPPPDLDCAEVRVMLRAQGLTVVELLPGGSDPHRLDGDGDGRGCEIE